MAIILILGAGIGGQVAAQHLRRALPDTHRIELFDRSAQHVFSPSLLWLMVGQRSAAQISRPVRVMLPPGVELREAAVEEIDLEKQEVRALGAAHPYDYLVLCLGADLEPQSIQGLVDGAHHYYDLPAAERLREALRSFSGGRVVLTVAGLPYKCPAAPYEGALLIDAYLRDRGLRAQSEVHLYTPEPQPMPVAGPALGEAVRLQLEARDIGFHPQRRLMTVLADSRRIALEDGEEVPYDLLIAIPPHRSPAVVREAGLTDESGWVPVHRHTLETRVPGVFALGDVAAIRLSSGMLLPKAGVFAHGQAVAVAARIASSLLGGSASDFDGLGFCWLETGRGAAAFAAGRFYAEPRPQVALRPGGRLWHWGKVLFERYWLDRWPGRAALRPLLQVGSSFLGVPAQL